MTDQWTRLSPEQQSIHRAVWDEALSDPAFVAALEAGEADFAADRTVPFKEIRMTDDLKPAPDDDPELDPDVRNDPVPTHPDDPKPVEPAPTEE